MCDTFVVMPPATADGSVIFGKNSDREPNEAQVLEYHAPASHPKNASIRCTHLEIPQVRETQGVLISRPFWMWGAEMGVNEKGVAIGNEAVWTRVPVEKKSGLLGMDLLRLALERAADASSALDIIVRLLHDHGQGGACSVWDPSFAYHNSYIIADAREAWVLETAGSLWAAKRVEDLASISNGLTLGEAFDEAHPDLVETARPRGWLKRGKAFHFARRYSDWFYTTFSASRRRQSCSHRLLEENAGNIDIRYAMRVLRDHGGEPYRPDSHFLFDHLCGHAANPLSRHSSQTTGSMIVRLTPEDVVAWATATAAPCTSVFKPVWLDGPVLPDLGRPSGTFDPASYWWRHEVLHRLVLDDFAVRLDVIEKERDILEETLLRQAEGVGAADRYALTEDGFQTAAEADLAWSDRIRSLHVQRRPRGYYRRYWKRQNKTAALPPYR